MTGTLPSRPMVTFALFAYNQEEYIREAVEAALAQTYEPLEIILSDDCSSDKTYAIMAEIAERYKGPHSLILNRNSQNLGVGAHVNKIFELSKSDLIIAAAGDDISMPKRTKTLVNRWLDDRCPPSLCSSVQLIDNLGRPFTGSKTYKISNSSASDNQGGSLIKFATCGDGFLLGCSAAWSRSIYEQFGPISKDVVNEDNVIAFRSWLSGKISFLQDPLVKYRQHDRNLHKTLGKPGEESQRIMLAEKMLEERARRTLIGIRQHLADLSLARREKIVNLELSSHVEKILRSRIPELETRAIWIQSSFLKRIWLMLENHSFLSRKFLRSMFIRLNMPLFYRVKAMRTKR